MFQFAQRLISLTILAGLFTGCASIVKKPEINGVRKVAIVSLYADQMIPWTGGTGRVDYFDLETKNRVALQAYKSFANEFKRLKWEVVPMERVTTNAYYKKQFGPQEANKDSNVLAKAANVLGTITNEGYFTATGLFPVDFIKEESKKDQDRGIASLDLASFKIQSKPDFKTQLGELARDLGVDAVVVAQLDYCYTGATAVLGNGTAKFTAGTTLRAYNGDKQAVVSLPAPKKRCESKYLGESSKTVAMVGGSISLAKAFDRDAIVTALSEASANSAKVVVAQIDAAILEK